MMSKPKYIVILTGLFCSVVAGVLHTFTRFFRKCFGKGCFFVMTTLTFGLASQAQAKNARNMVCLPVRGDNPRAGYLLYRRTKLANYLLGGQTMV